MIPRRAVPDVTRRAPPRGLWLHLGGRGKQYPAQPTARDADTCVFDPSHGPLGSAKAPRPFGVILQGGGDTVDGDHPSFDELPGVRYPKTLFPERGY